MDRRGQEAALEIRKVLSREAIGTRTDLFLLRDFLTPGECAAWIARSEDAGYDEAADVLYRRS